MECAFCSIDFSDKPYHRGERIYCSSDCADAHSEEIYDTEDMENEDNLDEELEEEF